MLEPVRIHKSGHFLVISGCLRHMSIACASVNAENTERSLIPVKSVKSFQMHLFHAILCISTLDVATFQASLLFWLKCPKSTDINKLVQYMSFFL